MNLLKHSGLRRNFLSGGASGAGAVSKVFGRVGAILAQVGDYAAFYDALGTAASAAAGVLAQVPTGIFPTIVPPKLADFAWLNQHGASASVNGGGGVVIQTPDAGAQGLEFLSLIAGIPATGNWFTDCGLMLLPGDNRTFIAGIAMRESATGQILTHTLFTDLGYVVQSRNNYTTFHANAFVGTAISLGITFWFFRVSYDSVNQQYNFYGSGDGQTWIPIVLAVPETTYFTVKADQIGVVIMNQGSATQLPISYNWFHCIEP